MAGRTLQFLAGALNSQCALVRAMPNTPAAIGRGITVAVARGANEKQRELAHSLLAATGAVEWVDDEALMDAVTAVSGSGPAYVFLLAETLAQAAVAAGLPPILAEKLARETVAGSGELLRRSGADGGNAARKCHLAGRHHRGRAQGADGPKWPGIADEGSCSRCDEALARACRLTSSALEAEHEGSTLISSVPRVEEFGHGPQTHPQGRRKVSARCSTPLPQLPRHRPANATKSSRPCWRSLVTTRSRRLACRCRRPSRHLPCAVARRICINARDRRCLYQGHRSRGARRGFK